MLIRPRLTEVEVATSHGIYRAAWLIGLTALKGSSVNTVTQESELYPSLA